MRLNTEEMVENMEEALAMISNWAGETTMGPAVGKGLLSAVGLGVGCT